jgi:membrane associated rhomboid family serine protease
MFAIVFSLSLVLLYLQPDSTALMASSQNIPGVVTSIFVHKDIVHLGVNLTLAFTALLLYSFSNIISGRRNDNFMVMATLLSAILANLAYVFMSPYSRVAGSSGLVSAFLGGIMTFAFLDAWTESALAAKTIQSIIGTFFFSAFIYLNLTVGPDTNVVVHLMSFSIMVFLVSLKPFWNTILAKTR